MSNIIPANEAQIAEFSKSAFDSLTAMGVPVEQHEALIANELGAQAHLLGKEADSIGDLLPEGMGDKMDDAAKQLPASATRPFNSIGGAANDIPTGGAAKGLLGGPKGKTGLIMKLLAALGIGGAAAGAGYKAMKATGAADEKEAMEKEVPGDIEIDKGEGESEADGSKDKAKDGIIVRKTKITVLKEAMVKVQAAKAEKMAHTALFAAAKDHMVSTMNIPEKQAQEILEKQYAPVLEEAVK